MRVCLLKAVFYRGLCIRVHLGVRDCVNVGDRAVPARVYVVSLWSCNPPSPCLLHEIESHVAHAGLKLIMWPRL